MLGLRETVDLHDLRLLSCGDLPGDDSVRAVLAVPVDLDQRVSVGVHCHHLEVVDSPVLLHSSKLRLEGEGAGLVDFCALHWHFELSLG